MPDYDYTTPPHLPPRGDLSGLRAGGQLANESRSPERPTLLTVITMIDAELDATQNLVLGLATRLEPFRFPSPGRTPSSARDDGHGQSLPPPAIARISQHYHRVAEINNLLRDIIDTLALE